MGFGLLITFIEHFNVRLLTTPYRLAFSVMVFTALLVKVFQQWTFLCSWAHVLTGWRPSHTNLPLLLTAISRLSLNPSLDSQLGHLMAGLGTDHTENIISNSSTIVAWMPVATIT
jgi:hypothetical protein